MPNKVSDKTKTEQVNPHHINQYIFYKALQTYIHKVALHKCRRERSSGRQDSGKERTAFEEDDVVLTKGSEQVLSGSSVVAVKGFTSCQGTTQCCPPPQNSYDESLIPSVTIWRQNL